MTTGGNRRRRTRQHQRDLGISYTHARQLNEGEHLHGPLDLSATAVLDMLEKDRLAGAYWRDRQPTVEDLVTMSPAFRALLDEVRAVREADSGAGRFCANRVWYGGPGHSGFRARLIDAVGWGSADIRLRSPKCYDVAYETLYGLLPDCRHGGGALGCIGQPPAGAK